MDETTLKTYDERSEAFAAQYERYDMRQLYALLVRNFTPGRPTADIGCGSGRDAAWLHAQGFPTVGYDASDAMIREAARLHPEVTFARAALPDLSEIPPERLFANVLCCGVLMHCPRAGLSDSLRALLRVTAPAGRLVLSFRQSRVPEQREADGRFFLSIAPDEFATRITSAGGTVLSRDINPDQHRAEILWNTMVVEKLG